jgi:hypothetical protein
MHDDRLDRWKPRIYLAAVLVFAFALGAAAIHVSDVASKQWGWSLLAELLRDLGIAFVIAAVVAAVFEIYRSVRHEVETMRHVIDVIMHDQLSPEVWADLKDLIDKKNVIRRNARIRLQLQRRPEMNPHEAELLVEFQYDLHPLTRKKASVTVSHELDYQFRNDQLGLPRFSRFVVDPHPGKATDLTPQNSEAKIQKELEFPPSSSLFYRISVDRVEVVHVPGSYNLYTPEFLKDFSLNVVESPQDVTWEVHVRPQGGGQVVKDVGGHSWSCEELLLPGQGIEIKMLVPPPTACRWAEGVDKDLFV